MGRILAIFKNLRIFYILKFKINIFQFYPNFLKKLKKKQNKTRNNIDFTNKLYNYFVCLFWSVHFFPVHFVSSTQSEKF